MIGFTMPAPEKLWKVSRNCGVSLASSPVTMTSIGPQVRSATVKLVVVSVHGSAVAPSKVMPAPFMSGWPARSSRMVRFATGGTAAAQCELVERLGGTVVGCSFLVELGFLGGRERLAGRDIHSLISFDAA